MFNKPGIFNRNDPVSPRPAVPVVGANQRTPVSVAEASRDSVVVRSQSSTSAAPPALVAEATTAQKPVVPALARDSGANENTMGARLIVGPEVKLKGAEILDCDTLVVEGRVEATMDSRVIRIAENGSFSGKVSIDIAEIHGVFEGELTARSQLIIHATGRVSGTIRYGKLVADEGCELCGDVNILTENAGAKIKAVVEPFLALNAAAG